MDAKGYKECKFYRDGHCIYAGFWRMASCSAAKEGVCAVWLGMEREWTEAGYVLTTREEAE